MVMKLKKDKNRQKKTAHKIPETKISNPENVYTEDKKDNHNKKDKAKKLGRPRKNKSYSSLRLQKQNVGRINAFQNALGYSSQDDFITDALNKVENDLTTDQRTMFNMYLKAYEIRNNR